MNAEECLKLGQIEAAMLIYTKALQVCIFNKFCAESASIHNKLAHLLLQTKKYEECYLHSNESIKALDDNPKVCHTSEMDVHFFVQVYIKLPEVAFLFWRQ